MTDNKSGKKLYWVFAIYLGAIPILAIVGLTKLGIFTIEFNGTINMVLWLISTIIIGLIIKKPFDKIFYKYFQWEYDGVNLKSNYKNTKIKNNEILSIHYGIDIKIKGIGKYFDLHKAIYENSLVLLLADNRIIFMKLFFLENGIQLQDELVINNKYKISENKFNFESYNAKKIKWFRIQKILK